MRAAGVAVLSGFLALGAAAAQDRSTGAPGAFDYYLLSLSWSPAFCASARRPDPAECGARPYAFVVHGLWPQSTDGLLRGCQQPPPRLPRRIVDSMLDLMPAPKLVYHEWDDHGTCSGLAPDIYFDTVRKARAAVQIPPEFKDVHETMQVAPDAVRDAFVHANPGLTEDAIAITCDNRLREVRICLGKDLQFRACPDEARRSCRRASVTVPPVRGQSAH